MHFLDSAALRTVPLFPGKIKGDRKKTHGNNNKDFSCSVQDLLRYLELEPRPPQSPRVLLVEHEAGAVEEDAAEGVAQAES